MIDAEDARWIALDNASEDWCGLYEIVWAYRTTFPAASDADRIAAARESVLCLLKDGLVEMSFYHAWGSKTCEPISGVDAMRIVADADAWNDPSVSNDGSYYAVSTTDRGDKVYFAGRSSAPHRGTKGWPGSS
jgi:hypothetical protein